MQVRVCPCPYFVSPAPAAADCRLQTTDTAVSSLASLYIELVGAAYCTTVHLSIVHVQDHPAEYLLPNGVSMMYGRFLGRQIQYQNKDYAFLFRPLSSNERSKFQ